MLATPAPNAESLLTDTATAVAEHLAQIGERPVAPSPAPEPATVRAWLSAEYDFEAARPAGQVVDDVLERLGEWSVHPTHPRYFGLFNPSPTTSSIAGELLAAGVNPQLAAWSHAPAAVEAEQHVLRFFARRLGLSTGTLAGNITTGGAEANLTAVLLALTHAFPRYATEGLRGLPRQPVLYASSESHLAWLKIAHATGLGRDALRLVPVDASLRLEPSHLRAAIAADERAGRAPFLVVATAGTTGAGAIDPLPELADCAAEAGLWLHVDAAWAGAIALSDRLRPLLSGIERADSVTVDAHKWISVPMGAGMLLTSRSETLAAAFGLETGYMPSPVDGAVDPYSTSLQWSRRFAGLKILMTLAIHGRAGYAAQLEHDVELGHRLAQGLAAVGWRPADVTPLPVVCATHPAGAEDDAWYASVCERVIAAGAGWISPVRLDGRPAVRACITSHRTTTRDVDRLVLALRDAVG